MTDSSDMLDMIDAALAKEPMLSALAKDPMLPIDSTEPTDPMDKIESREPIDRRDPVDPTLQREGVCVMGLILARERGLPLAGQRPDLRRRHS